MDEVDLKTIESRMYKCLKLDIGNKDQARMFSLTPYGMAFLNKEGMVVNEFGQVRQKENGKECQNRAEKPRNLDGKMRQIGEMARSLNEKYFKQPTDIYSKRGGKKAKKDLSNYIGQAWHGYLSGDRSKFADLNKIIQSLTEKEKEADNIKIFISLRNIMDDIEDRNLPGPDCW